MDSNLHKNNSPENNHGHVVRSRPSRSIAHRQNKARHERDAVQPQENYSQNLSHLTQQLRISQTRRQDLENEEEIANSKPGKDHVDNVEDELDKEGQFPQNRVIRPEEVVEVENRIKCREKRT